MTPHLGISLLCVCVCVCVGRGGGTVKGYFPTWGRVREDNDVMQKLVTKYGTV